MLLLSVTIRFSHCLKSYKVQRRKAVYFLVWQHLYSPWEVCAESKQLLKKYQEDLK